MESESWTVTLKGSNPLMMCSSLLATISKHHWYPCRGHQEPQLSFICLQPSRKSPQQVQKKTTKQPSYRSFDPFPADVGFGLHRPGEGAFLMGSSRGKGQFPHYIENKWKRQSPDRWNRWPDQLQACSSPRAMHTWADSSPRGVHLVAQAHRARTSGKLALVFHPEGFLLSMQNCSPKIPPKSPEGLHSHHLLQLKYPPLADLWNGTTKGKGQRYVLSLFSSSIHLHSLILRLCSQSAVPSECLSLKPGKTLPRVCRAWGRPSQGLPASVALHLQPSWSTSYNTFFSVFIHLLSQKHLAQRNTREMFKTQM